MLESDPEFGFEQAKQQLQGMKTYFKLLILYNKNNNILFVLSRFLSISNLYTFLISREAMACGCLQPVA